MTKAKKAKPKPKTSAYSVTDRASYLWGLRHAAKEANAYVNYIFESNYLNENVYAEWDGCWDLFYEPLFGRTKESCDREEEENGRAFSETLFRFISEADDDEAARIMEEEIGPSLGQCGAWEPLHEGSEYSAMPESS